MRDRFSDRPTAVAAIAFAIALAITSAPRLAASQSGSKSSSTGTFTGVVTRDTLGHPVSGAEIAIPALNRSLKTNDRGEFRFDAIPAGTHLVTVRAIGFAPFADSVGIAAGGTLDGDLTLTPSTTLLDTLRTTAARSTLESRALAEFETRRTAHISGGFISDSTLRANDEAKLSSLISRLPGVHAIQGKSTEVYIASAHATTDGRPAFQSSARPCFVTVYLDGIRKYQAHVGNDDPPNFQNMRASDFAGVEFYASPGMAPAEFSATGSDCGVLLLWSRRDRTTPPNI